MGDVDGCELVVVKVEYPQEGESVKVKRNFR
jgi:hypothetical protein